LELRRRTKKTTSAMTARNRSEPPTAPAISGVLSVVPIAVADDDDVVVVAAAVVDAFVVAVVGGLAALQVAIGSLGEQEH
jgi:hypothetical protein